MNTILIGNCKECCKSDVCSKKEKYQNICANLPEGLRDDDISVSITCRFFQKNITIKNIKGDTSY